MVKVELTRRSANPFYGMKNALELYQYASKGTIPYGALDRAWIEVQSKKEAREMFFSILFSVGDITARQHNVFGKRKVDSGGNASRAAFLQIVDWMKKNNYPQFKKFLFAYLFNEFVSFDVLFTNRVKTTKKKKNIESFTSSLSGTPEYINDLSDFCVNVIQGNNPSHKHFLAKFLTRPKTNKRKGHKVMLPQTKQLMKNKSAFLAILSEKLGFEVIKRTTHLEFPGYINWRKKYLGDIESVMFSSLRVREFDKDQFQAWINNLPAGARYRVRTRLLNKDNSIKMPVIKKGETAPSDPKWGELGKWFLDWEKNKEVKQKEVRVLTEKVRQGIASESDVVKLKEVTKEAKVTTGAVNFADMYVDIVTGTVDKLKVQPFLDKINLPYNSLVFVDDSGSMAQYKCNGVTAFDFACFMATICLTKNPDDVGRSLMGFFSQRARLYNTMTSRSTLVNSLVRSNVKTVNEPLIQPEMHFLDNLKRIREFAYSVRTSNGTHISSIPDHLFMQLQDDRDMREQLQAFPVWTIISDGNWNNMSSPEASMNDFMKRCENHFGFKPFVIAIDVAGSSSANISRFSGIDNFMMIPPNPAQIEQLLTNFRDIDMMDVYTPLQSIHRSNRYDLVRAATV
jgi:hypothetical protein